jgi:hypothetical protein
MGEELLIETLQVALKTNQGDRCQRNTCLALRLGEPTLVEEIGAARFWTRGDPHASRSASRPHLRRTGVTGSTQALGVVALHVLLSSALPFI